MGLKHKCCDWCLGGIKRRDFRNGAVDEDDFADLTPYRKRKKRGCKKSKSGEPCDYSVPIIERSFYGRDEWWHHYRVMTCSRCGKHGWGIEGGGYFKTKEPI